jgi:hypothetical protein
LSAALPPLEEKDREKKEEEKEERGEGRGGGEVRGGRKRRKLPLMILHASGNRSMS